MTTVELRIRIRNGDESRTLTATGSTYDAARADVDAQVPEGWQKVLYFQR